MRTKPFMKIETIANDNIDVIEPLWIELNRHQLDPTRYFEAYYRQNNFARRKAVLLAKDQLMLRVVEVDSQHVGFCVASVNCQIAEIDSLYVKPGARDNGIGAALMDSAFAWLSKQSVSSVRLLVGEGNESVIAFYQKYGFSRRAVLLETNLNRSEL